MAEQGLPESGSEAAAQRWADRLALALEDVGFDVGREFPMLRSIPDQDGSPVVELGRVTVPVAAGLSMVLAQAARLGIGLSTD